MDQRYSAFRRQWAWALSLAALTGLFSLDSASAADAPFYANRTNLLVVTETSGVQRPVKTAADWQQRRVHILVNMEQVMGPVPRHWSTLPLEARVLEQTNVGKITCRKVAFRVEPNDVLTAWLLLPRAATSRCPAVLCLHQTTALGKDEPAGLGGSAELHYAQELAERGFITLAPDYWTFGDYRAKDYDPFQHGYASGTMKGIWNHRRCLDYLQSLPEVNREQLGAIGHSLGGHNALWLAAFDERVKAVVSSCGFCTFASYAGSKYGGGNLKNWAQRRYLPRIAERYGNDPARIPFDWPEVLAAIAPRAVFVNAPLQDENFVVEGVRECVQAASGVFALLGAPNNLVAVHPATGHRFPDSVRWEAYEFLERTLRR